MKKKKTKTLNDLPKELRGMSQNRWGGHKTQNLKGFRQNTYGAASPCRSLSQAEIEQWIANNPL
jgi:hypothetical protein